MIIHNIIKYIKSYIIQHIKSSCYRTAVITECNMGNIFCLSHIFQLQKK